MKEKTNAVFDIETSVKNAPTEWFINAEKVVPSAKHQLEVDGIKQRLIINNCAKPDECEVKCTLKEAETKAKLNVTGRPDLLLPSRCFELVSDELRKSYFKTLEYNFRGLKTW